MKSEPHNHHYVPQFYLKAFATDDEKMKVNALAKNGPFAVWSRRSIQRIGYERDFYVHIESGAPVSVETGINRIIETPISKSDTWAKIKSGNAHALDRSDKLILYALIRHLESRTPHRRQTFIELTNFAANNDPSVAFTDEEREYYKRFHNNPDATKAHLNKISESLVWTIEAFRGAGISVFRSPIPLRTSTTPAISIRAPAHPSLHLPLPGMIPFQTIMTLNPYTCASLVLGNFDDAFTNCEMNEDEARGYNRHFIAQFTYFSQIRHVITDKNADLVSDMNWANYELISDEGDKKAKFKKLQQR